MAAELSRLSLATPTNRLWLVAGALLLSASLLSGAALTVRGLPVPSAPPPSVAAPLPAPPAPESVLSPESVARADAILARPIPAPPLPGPRAESLDGPVGAALADSGASSSNLQELAPAVTAALDHQPRDILRPRATGWQGQFIHAVGLTARTTHGTAVIPPSVTIAQAILESDWGRSSLARAANNFFGIKAHGRSGTAGHVMLPTLEYDGEHWVWVQAPFRAYATLADSVDDHHRFLLENPRYASALQHREDPAAFVSALQRAGYATDPYYAAKLLQVMDRYDLYRYDGR